MPADVADQLNLFASANDKACKHCGRGFLPRHGLQVLCGQECKIARRNESRSAAYYKRRDEEVRERRCTACDKAKPIEAFYRGKLRCKDCEAAWRAGHRKRHPERNHRLAVERHGLTVEEYRELLASQGDSCAVCRRPSDDVRLHIDHDHRCCPGAYGCRRCVRGILCGSCNRAIGLLRDDSLVLRRAARYLEANGLARSRGELSDAR